MTTPTYLIQARGHLWSSLQVYNLYRFILACMVLLAHQAKLAPELLLVGNQSFFVLSTYGYVSFALFAFYITWKDNLLSKTFSYLAPILDLLFVSVLMQSSGGVTHGMGVLFVIVIIAQTLLNPGYWAIATTFFGCTLLIGLQLYDWIFYPISRASLLPTLALGLTCISGAFLASRLLKKVTSQSLALSTAEELNSLIVSLMQNGVIIIDQQQQTKLINQKAKQLLNLSSNPNRLENFPEDFQCLFAQKIVPHLSYRLDIQSWGKGQDHAQNGQIIFLYDLMEEKKRAQTLKLASLGQLAANLAHEIRNPLSAINQAAQLLAELNQAPQQNRLLEILLDNSKRINTVIKNVLSLSTRALPQAKNINLISWLEDLSEDLYFSYTNQLHIEKTYPLEPVHIQCDASQLRQVLLNLCENGIRYSLKKNKIATLKIQVSLSKERHKSLIHIDIIDNGKGISAECLKHLFEPFYTTERNGSGLGLFVAKELIELNGGQLKFINHFPTGCQFRVTLYEKK